ncbi:MAG: glycosyltransferase family 1 protein [Patescibacteria group bacterium]
MRIGIDVRCFAQGKNTGVEEYTKKALLAVFDRDKENEYILFFNAWRGQAVDFSWATKYENVTLKKYTIPNKLLNACLWLLDYPKLDKLCGGVDAFFMPNSNFYAISARVKIFLTVHDLSFDHYKETFSLKRRIWHFFVNPRVLAKRAYHIFTVSEATKEDVCETYRIKGGKISVAKNGLSSVQGTFDRNSIDIINVKEKYDLPYNFILYFGTIEPRKNIVNVIKAYEKVRLQNEENLNHKLVIAGSHGWSGCQVDDAVKNSKYKEDIKIIKNIPEEEKELIYALASVFVYPSFFEGFGFPPLEAITCRIPTIVSNKTSLPEVVGDNAIMVDPMRTDELVDALTAIIDNKKLQSILTKNSQAHIKKFTWDLFAKKFVNKTYLSK